MTQFMLVMSQQSVYNYVRTKVSRFYEQIWQLRTIMNYTTTGFILIIYLKYYS